MHQVPQKACQQPCMSTTGSDNGHPSQPSQPLGTPTKINAGLVFIGSCLGNANNFLSVHKHNAASEGICEKQI